MALSDTEKLQIAEAYIAASRTNDPAALAAVCSADSITWHNFDEAEVGPAHSAKAMGWIHRTVPDITWTTLGLTATSGGFVWQSLLSGTAPGGQLHCHSCIVATMDDGGKITRIAEYLDTAQTKPLRG